METEHRAQDERFRLIVEAAPNAIVVVDAAGRIVLVNSQTEILFGYAREELLGSLVEVLVPTRFRAAHPQERRSFFASPRARPMGAGRDLYGRRKDGSEFPVEIGLNPIETEDGTLVLSAIVDITERKRAEERLAAQTQALARSNAELQQFAYVASHDLQEPLRAVAASVELLQRRYGGQLDARADEYIRHAVDGATRMQALIHDLLAYSRVDTLAQPAEPNDLGDLLAAALRNLRAAVQEAGATVTHDELPVIVCDATQIVQLLQNLIGNALKFRGEAPPRVHVSAREAPGEWIVSVRDNGIGIEPQYFERIFRMFQRLHTREEYPGTGIGLAICRKVVERHGGHVWVDSTPGAGATFSFTLPIRTVGPDEAD